MKRLKSTGNMNDQQIGKMLNFKTNLPNMKFDYSKLDETIIFYAEL